MPISATCSCGKEYDVRDEFAGKQIKCDACGQVIEVPKVAAQLVPSPFKAAPAPMPEPLPIMAPMPDRAAPVRAAPEPKETGPEAHLPPMAAVEILMPFRGYPTSWSILPDAEVTKSFRAAHVTHIGGWANWIMSHPEAVPAIMFLGGKQITKEKLFGLLGGRAPEMEQETIPADQTKNKKDLPITWYKYQDVAFAVDSLGMVVAIRISAVPAAALPPVEPPAAPQ